MNAYRMTMEWARLSRVRTLGLLECGSTNLEAKSQLETLGHRSLVVTEHQTAGRGRGDHTWTDMSGHALLSSWIFHAPKAPQPIMSALIGLALIESAVKTWPKIPWALKAPNDLHIVDKKNGKTFGAKKAAGILIELLSVTAPKSSSSGAAGVATAVIVGLGMNVTDFPTGTKPYPATALAAELATHELPFTENDWSRFLSLWLVLCENAVNDGLQSELKPEACDALTDALSRHPDYRELETVREDGSLVFKNGRTVAWSEL